MPIHYFIFLLSIFLSVCTQVPSWPPVSSFMSKPTLVLIGPVLKSEKEVGSLESRFLRKAIREVTQKQDQLFPENSLSPLNHYNGKNGQLDLNGIFRSGKASWNWRKKILAVWQPSLKAHQTV